MAIENSEEIRSFVAPIVELSFQDGSLKFDRLRGTGFVVGDRQTVVTAGHVVNDPESRLAMLFLDDDGQWSHSWLVELNFHPSEDIAVGRLHGDDRKSPVSLGRTSVPASSRWSSWGYPDDISRELVIDGYAQNRPDLIFIEGYVRRRMTDIPIDEVKGSAFLELSEIGGRGFSGSPVLLRDHASSWVAVAVYAWEKCSDSGVNVSYAVRIDAIVDWYENGVFLN